MLDVPEFSNPNKELYNKEPVFYCKNCLSLKIRGIDYENELGDIEFVEGSEYCDVCTCGDIVESSYEDWDKLYVEKYGHHYLDEAPKHIFRF